MESKFLIWYKLLWKLVHDFIILWKTLVKRNLESCIYSIQKLMDVV